MVSLLLFYKKFHCYVIGLMGQNNDKINKIKEPTRYVFVQNDNLCDEFALEVVEYPEYIGHHLNFFLKFTLFPVYPDCLV